MIPHRFAVLQYFLEDKMLSNMLTQSMAMFAATALFLCSGTSAMAQTRISVGVTETIETHNPYGDSVSLLYGIFSEITGPFCTYNYSKGDFEGRLAERWKNENPTTWIFYLSKNYRFNDGSSVTVGGQSRGRG